MVTSAGWETAGKRKTQEKVTKQRTSEESDIQRMSTLLWIEIWTIKFIFYPGGL